MAFNTKMGCIILCEMNSTVIKSIVVKQAAEIDQIYKFLNI